MKIVPTSERRASARKLAGECSWLMASRVRPGRDVKVVNLSDGGALVEGGRMVPGTRIYLQLLGRSRRHTISGRVVRSAVCGVDGDRGVRYRAALCFDTGLAEACCLPLDLPARGGRGVAVSRRERTTNGDGE